nr:IgGFc-binding protein [Misgurnus anguillicaudatus]
MFAIFLVVSMFSQGLTIVSYGNSFITAFPENLGYYYTHTSRSLRVTALHEDTSVDIFYNGSSTPTKTISINQKGNTVTLKFPKSAEVYQLDYATQSIRISSTKNIVVHSGSNTYDEVNKKSVQTNVVQPDENLDTHYLIPSLNYTDLLATFGISPPDIASKRYGSFRLIIINAEDTENNITIVKNISGSIQLESFMIPSYQLIQLQADASLMMVNSSDKIAVLLTHPCLEKPDCKCSMIVNQILPVRFQGQNFVVPSFPGITQRWLLDTSNDKTNSLPQNNTNLMPNLSGLWSISDPDKSQYVTASSNMSLRLISPGLFLELIPENMFAACYLLHFYTYNKQAIVIAKTDSKDEVHTGDTLQNAVWTEIPDTEYSSATITLNEKSSVIWHPSSKIAVYILENPVETIFGGPAIPINEKPDKSGCVVIPGVFNVGHEPLKWAESLDSCAHDQKEFACPTDEGLQMDLVSAVGTTDAEGWIGLRRSLMTTEWYWKNQTSPSSPSPPVTYVNWGDGEPQDTLKGFCASLSLDGTDDFKWKSAKCCEEKFPICYKPPTTIVPEPQPYQTENIP